MAECLYYINGKQVTENELKEVLNAGLLDNLINTEKISLADFPINQNTILSKKENQPIPAKYLQKILLEEVEKRSGYPLNMKAALELDETGQDFKIPLWASPYASKFESILTSLVSQGVINQKINGKSFVLGSPEGIKTKTKVETLDEKNAQEIVQNLGIVTLGDWDPSQGLLPMRYDPKTNSILPAQIMIPFKFKDNYGKSLNLKDFIKEENGKRIIDLEKIPREVLQLFGFRIPTQGHNSMTSAEIVGFLPEECGDLIFAPRDLTKQMGSDFDIDKLYTYIKNTFLIDGQLKTNFISDASKIEAKTKEVKKSIKSIIEELQFTKEESKKLEEYLKSEEDSDSDIYSLEDEEEGTTFKTTEFLSTHELIKTVTNSFVANDEEYQEILKELDKARNLLQILKKSYKASRQNTIMDVHHAILKSTNPEIIASVFALDSPGVFKDFAEMFVELEQTDILSPFSPKYQKDKYVNATAGKTGIANFSTDATFNASVQGKNLIFRNFVLEKDEQVPSTYEEIYEKNDIIARFGTIVSKGDISNPYTLASQKLIEENGGVITEKIRPLLKKKSLIFRNLQSAAVDNASSEILDKININDNTFNFIRAMVQFGFEELDIVAVLKQPIIVEYIAKLNLANSSISEFDRNAEENITKELQEKYDPTKEFESLSKEQKEELEISYSSEQLLSLITDPNQITADKVELKSGTPDANMMQLIILEKFKLLSDFGINIKELQSAINSDTKAVPKSLIETSTKLEQISKVKDGILIFNAETLFTDTLSGYAVDLGVQYANDIFAKYYPYNTEYFQFITKEISLLLPENATKSVAKSTEIKEKVLEALKAYAFSAELVGLFTGDTNQERKRLFIDSETNMSLASIINEVKKQSWATSNAFLEALIPSLNSNGEISRVNYEAATAELFDESNIHLAFSALLTSDKNIGTFNGIVYTPKRLAQELIAAAYLEGGHQSAKQYLKYVPISYLKQINFSKIKESFFSANIDLELKPSVLNLSQFSMQFAQNNPDLVPKIELSNLAIKVTKAPPVFVMNLETAQKHIFETIDPAGNKIKTLTPFVSIYIGGKKTNEKYALYKYSSETNMYHRVDSLNNNYGFVQYNADNPVINIIQKKTEEQESASLAPEATASPGLTKPAQLPSTSSQEETKDKLYLQYREGEQEINELATEILIDDNVADYNKLLLTELLALPIINIFQFKYDPKILEWGNFSQFSINLQPKEMLIPTQGINKYASILNHELIHAHSANLINKYLDNPDSLTDSQRKAVKKLENLQGVYIEFLKSQGLEADLERFREDYKKFKNNEGVSNFLRENKDKFYGAIKLTEFITMALTDVKFQQILNSIKFEDSGVSLWQKFMEALTELLISLGIDVKEGYLLKAAIRESLNILKENTTYLSNYEKEIYLLSLGISFVKIDNDRVAPHFEGKSFNFKINSFSSSEEAVESIFKELQSPNIKELVSTPLKSKEALKSNSSQSSNQSKDVGAPTIKNTTSTQNKLDFSKLSGLNLGSSSITPDVDNDFISSLPTSIAEDLEKYISLKGKIPQEDFVLLSDLERKTAIEIAKTC